MKTASNVPFTGLARADGEHLEAANESTAPRFNHLRPNPPFTNGKVWFGLAYVPKPMPIEAEAQRLQRALLDSRTTTSHPSLPRLILNALRSVLS